MKKFIVFIITAIMLMATAMSCGNNVKKDIETIVGDNVSVSAVKSIDIKENFYQYTEEYTRSFERMEYWGKSKVGWLEVKLKYEDLFDKYPSSKSNESVAKNYEDAVNSYQESVDSSSHYMGICMFLESEEDDSGKLYIAKMRGRNEYTNKPNEYNSYAIFAYNSDGTLHQIDTGDNMKIIFSVYPKAKEDFKKAMGDAMAELVDALAD